MPQELEDPSNDEDDDALTSDARRESEIDQDDDEDELDLEDELRLASDPQGARPGDAPQAADIDDDDEDEDVLTDDGAHQLAIDDDDEEQDDEEDELEDALDAQDAPAADAPMQSAEADADATADDPRVGTLAPVTADDGFSFSLFPKPAVPTEVAKESMPAEHLAPDDMTGSGMPASETAIPGAGSEDAGNAAPSNERVVHHGDLAP